MAAVGSLLFCKACGNLLDNSTGDPEAEIICTVCETSNPDQAFKTVTIHSKPNAFPSLLRAKRSAVQTLTAEDMQQDALSSDPCPDCGTMMRFHTQQLRSADEGTTVFYSCDNCGHKHTTNN